MNSAVRFCIQKNYSDLLNAISFSCALSIPDFLLDTLDENNSIFLQGERDSRRYIQIILDKMKK